MGIPKTRDLGFCFFPLRVFRNCPFNLVSLANWSYVRSTDSDCVPHSVIKQTKIYLFLQLKDVTIASRLFPNLPSICAGTFKSALCR